LKEYQRNIGDASTQPEDANTNGEVAEPADDAANQRMVIQHLVDYLRGC